MKFIPRASRIPPLALPPPPPPLPQQQQQQGTMFLYHFAGIGLGKRLEAGTLA